MNTKCPVQGGKMTHSMDGDVIGELYSLSGHIDCLPRMIELVARAVGADAARIGLPPDLVGGGMPFLDFNVDPFFSGQYLEHWTERDLWFQGHQRLRSVARGPVIAPHRELVDRATLHRSDFYSDFLAAQNFDSVAVLDLDALGEGPATGCSVALLNMKGHEELSRRDLDGHRALFQHLHRVIYLTTELERSKTMRSALLHGLEAAGVAMAFLAASGKVVFMTRDFRSAIDGWIQVQSNELRSPFPGVNDSLRHAIRAAVLRGGRADVVSMGRGRSRHALLLRIFPMPESLASSTCDAGIRAIIQVHDPERIRVPDWAMLNDLFGLTRAEVRLCQGLHRGLTVMDYCTGQGISQATARSQLHSVFQKTGTGRQSELIALLASLSP